MNELINKKLVIVSHQDPRHMTGGQGVSLINIAREASQLTNQPVAYLSMRLRGEPEEEWYEEGKIRVHRVSVLDSDDIATPYQGDEREQIKRRIDFNNRAVQYIRTEFPDPNRYLIYLNGFHTVPLLARDLSDYATLSCYHLILSKRMECTGETDIFYDETIKYERESILANKRIHLCSRGIRDEVLSLVPPDRREEITRRIAIIPMGVEDELLDTPIPEKSEETNVVAWGRITPEKGFECLIEAFAEIQSKVPQAKLTIFGKTDDAERKRKTYTDQLKNLAKENKQVRLLFSDEGIRGKEKLSLIDSASVAVIPSLYEPFGIVQVEALARAIPLVATLNDGAVEIFQTQEPGLGNCGASLVPLHGGKPKPSDIARAVTEILLDPTLQKKMGEDGRKLAESYRWKGITRKILAAFEPENGG